MTTNQPIYLVEFTDTDHTVRYSASHKITNAMYELEARSTKASVRYVLLSEMTPDEVMESVYGDDWVEGYEKETLIEDLQNICYSDCMAEMLEYVEQNYQEKE